MRSTLRVVLGIGWTGFAATAAFSQSYSISWYTIDGGGGVSAGGGFTLIGTIGQPDAGTIIMGGSFDLLGGFIPGLESPPCRADFNQDGSANSQDFFDFLTAFFAMAPNADFNGDAVVNSQDFFDFLTAFFVDCP